MHNCYQCNHYQTTYSRMTDRRSEPGCTCHLAIANVPWQYFTNSYDPDRSLRTGTMFPELDKPFLGRSVR